jgi:hypothetical protein
MSSELTKQDLNLLFEAVEAWENEQTGPPMGMQLMASMGQSTPGLGEALQERVDELKREAVTQKRQRKERGVLLRAKLVTLRDQFEASQFVDSLGRTADDET